MANVYIISSSPPSRHLSIFDMPSSPPLPSVNDILKKKPQALRTGSRASPVPQIETAALTSAATLLQKEPSRDIDVNAAEDSTRTLKPMACRVSTKKVDNVGKVAKPKKLATKKDVTFDGETLVKKPRKTRAEKADIVGEDGIAVTKVPVQRKSRAKKLAQDTLPNRNLVEKPPRKTKAKKDPGSQTKLPKGKVTKASTASDPKALGSTLFEDNLDHGLVEAISRRKAWTPPPSRQDSITTPASVGLLGGSVSVESLLSGEKLNGFTDLLGNFGFTKAEGQTTKPTVAAVGIRKRKLIELVKTSVAAAAATSPEKAAKKKARTLTDLATSAYAELEEEEPPADPAPLLQYFSLQTAERTTTDGFKIPSKSRSKIPTKGAAKGKKGTLQAPILLSPESAMKQVGRQDFVFGTSSQLAREDSPTLLRDLHEAMQASNEAEDDPFADFLIESVSQTISDQGKSSVSTKRNLWSAASHGGEAIIEDIDTIELVDTPVPAKTAAVQGILDPQSSMLDGDDESFWHDVEELSQSLTQKSQPVEAQSQISVSEDLIDKSPPSPTKRIALEAESLELTLPASTQPPESSQPAIKPTRKPRKPKELVKPDFSSYTTAQLTKEIASYKFKPIKSRNSMITLLEKCWEGKNKIALAAQSTNKSPIPLAVSSKSAVPTKSQPAVSPKRPRGRPRKDSTASPEKPNKTTPRKKGLTSVEYLEMDSDTPLSQMRTPRKSPKKPKDYAEDIFDSEPRLTPSPPRRKISPKKTKALTLKFSSSLSDASVELSPTSSQRHLFKHISSAVTTASPAKDSINPSWHEKILVYDPIILEDLTVWLNTGALEKAGWDGEVDPKEVKKWCESKSICCLWRENLRGGTRSRY
ncbi:related to Structure-specific endonuclease subunit slx4 [Rhynchosporium agropyri]|uniref:Structure-specific endonuclease subunit SLX4 n=1 Tax=Rhynchosporium agropyri TaxID=914238 RepID=A0A1E1KXR7_9HELO|nr:related to Structure-specific endonuclease subunit slx4 [Rhynchosporium agropyri]